MKASRWADKMAGNLDALLVVHSASQLAVSKADLMAGHWAMNLVAQKVAQMVALLVSWRADQLVVATAAAMVAHSADRLAAQMAA